MSAIWDPCHTFFPCTSIQSRAVHFICMNYCYLMGATSLKSSAGLLHLPNNCRIFLLLLFHKVYCFNALNHLCFLHPTIPPIKQIIHSRLDLTTAKLSHFFILTNRKLSLTGICYLPTYNLGSYPHLSVP